MISALLMLALVASEAPAAATSTDAPAAQTAPAAPAKPKPDELVCHNERELGSNLPHRVCRRQSDIDARAQQDAESLERAQAAAPYAAPQ